MHRHLPRAAAALALACCLAPRTRAEGPAGPVAAAHEPRTLTTQFTYKATVPQIPAGAHGLRLWIPLPSNGALQTVRDVKVDSPVPYRITREPKYGNRMVYVESDHASAPLSVSVSCVVERKEAQVLGADPGAPASLARGNEALSRYLQPDSKVPLGGRYGAIALEVAGNEATPLDKARALYEHVVSTMQYDYKKESPEYAQGDVAFVCDYKKGNCSDLHSYLISLARSLGIPAYLEFGFPITGIPVPSPLPKEGAIGGYHCWTWFHDPALGWVPLDASDGRRWLDSGRPDIKRWTFGNLVVERSAAAFSIGRDITLSPAQKGAPLNYFIYPYAEADGASIKADWEVRYAVINAPTPMPGTTAAEVTAPVAVAQAAEPSSQDLQRQIDELRRMVTEQAQEIARLREGQRPGRQPAPSGPTQTPVATASGTRAGFYGFLRLDAIEDSAQTNNAQTPFFVQSPSNPNVAFRGNSQFALHPRLSRFGFNLAAPPDTLRGTNVTGKLEVDFQNGSGLTPESRPLPRIRHAYIQLQRGPNAWLFGQTWDVISPLYPSPNDDTLMWNAGNLGDRRPQIRYTNGAPNRPFSAALALGLTGAVDAQDLDANGVRDGEDSGAPNVQGRVAWKSGPATLGLWGHYAWEDTTKPVAGRREFRSYSLGLDLQDQITRALDLSGELWLGSNLSDFRGGIGQGVDPKTGNEIRSHGGWLEVGYRTSPRHRMAVGYTEDNPADQDVPAGGRLKNYSVYLHNRWRLGGHLEVGANYLYWLTKWSGLASGVDNRFNAFIQQNF